MPSVLLFFVVSMSVQGKKRVDPRWLPAPECVTPEFPPYGTSLSLLCKAMTLPLLPEQVLKPNGKLMRPRTNNFVSRDLFNVPTFFFSKCSFKRTKFAGKNIFELDERLLGIVRAMDKALGRKTNGLFIFNSIDDDHTFKPLYETITKRYKCLDLIDVVKQDMIRGHQAFDVDNHDIDFVFAFVDWPLEICVNLVNHLNKPVFMCGEYVQSTIKLT